MPHVQLVPRPTLTLQTVYLHDDDRQPAREVGSDLYAHLTRPPQDPLGIGAGVPVGLAVAGERVDLAIAECLVLVPVLGSSSFQFAQSRIVERLREWHEALGDGHVLPLLISNVWRNVEEQLPGAPLLSELYGDPHPRRKTLDDIVLSIMRLLDPEAGTVPLFISHAKADLDSTEEAAKRIHQHVVTDSTGRAFFDVTGIAPGVALADQLEQSAGRGVFVMVRSDAYSSRTWCQRELLTAKRGGLPTLTVELLVHGELRSLPYGGNGPSMVWKGDPAAVASRAMVEWLRAEHFRREAARLVAGAGLPYELTPLPRPPELLDLAQGPLRSDRAQLVLHPDPELPALEAQVLATAYPRLRLATPTTVFRRLLTRPGERSSGAPLDGLRIAMSLSDSPDVDGPDGYTAEHHRDATVHLARSLIAVGAAIAYGGDFRQHGFTELLVELIEAYNQTAREKADFLHSYLAANLDPGEGRDLALRLHHLRGPGGVSAEACLPWPPGEPAPAAALYFSDMRRVMARHFDARVVLGGAAVPRREEGDGGYGGRFPGVVEEAWRALQASKPLYVVGGFGGAAEIVARLLAGEETPERLREGTWSDNALYQQRMREIDTDPYRDRLGLPDTLEALAETVRELGSGVLASDEAALAWNGLTVEENRRLFRTRDLVTLTSLVLKGLLRRYRETPPGTLQIELVQGSVAQAQDLNALAVATFDDVPLGGAGEAIDQAIGGAASRQRREGRQLTPITVDSVDADWLYLASLGPLGDVSRLAERVETAARATAAVAWRYGFERLGLVTYGGSVVQDLSSVVNAMLCGLQDLAGISTLSWFESDDQRYGQLRAALEKRPGVKLTTRRLAVERAVGVTDRREAYLQVSLDDGVLSATFLPPSGNGIASTHRRELSEDELAGLSAGVGSRDPRTPDLEALSARGVELSLLLLGNEASAHLARCDDAKLVVVHDVASSRLPYETLSGTGSDHAPAVRGGISRRLAVEGVRSERLHGRPPQRPPLQMLLIIDPQENLPGARKEGEAVEATIQSLNKAREATAGIAVNLQVLRSPVQSAVEEGVATLENVLSRLSGVDILHFCGHAAFAGPGEGRSGIHLADGFLSFEQLGEVDLPRVAFVNSCEIGRVRAEVPVVDRAASFAEHFLRAGVEAYLGTFWRVQDEAAVRFAVAVYQRLAMGGTLETAVTAARGLLRSENERDWANYVLYGDGRFQLVAT